MTPDTAHPLPTAGGSYIRQPDGSLSPEAAATDPAPATLDAAPTAPGHANPEE